MATVRRTPVIRTIKGEVRGRRTTDVVQLLMMRTASARMPDR